MNRYLQLQPTQRITKYHSDHKW